MNTIHAKKSLGQHFLRSKEALAQIIDATKLTASDLVLEIGPGEGVLTEALLATGATIVAVETDKRCLSLLNERFADALRDKRLILIEGDIRDTPTHHALFEDHILGDRPYKIVANIPYYITGFLFRLFLEHLRQPDQIVFLVQKEVAEQIVARNGKESLLSLSIKAYGAPSYIATIKREAFSPPPKVNSAIISVENISRERLGTLRDESYFRVLHAGLGSKRKMLLGNLSHDLTVEKTHLQRIFTDIGIDPKCRGEDVPFHHWITLAGEIEKFLPH